MLVGSTFRTNGLHFTYGCPALSAGYFSKVYLQNHLVRIHYGCVTLSAAYLCNLYVQDHWLAPDLWVSDH